MQGEGTHGTYRALPQINDEIANFILQVEGGAVAEFGATLKSLDSALQRVDEELQGLANANPNLATIIRGTVEGTYSVFSDSLKSESFKALLRAVAYVNAFVVLRALDMQLRKNQQP